MRFFLIQDPEHERQFIEYAQRCENIEVSNWRSTANLNPIWVFRSFSDVLDGEWLLERIGTSVGEPLYSLDENELLSLQIVPEEALIEYINSIGTLNIWYKEST